MTLPVSITGISTLAVPVGPFKVAAGDYGSVGITTGAPTSVLRALQGSGTASEKISQTFTNGASAMTIGSITIQGSKNQTPTDNILIDITATDSAGTVLGTSDPVPGTSVPFSASYYTFTFSTPVTISAGATFGVVFRRSGAGDTFNYYTVTGGNTNAYAGGSYFIYNGSTWADQATDLVCTVNKLTTIASDAYYFFGTDATTATTLRAYKTTDPEAGWSVIASKTGFTSTAVFNLAAFPVSPIIHLLVSDGTSVSAQTTRYLSFDATTDTFLTTVENVSAAAAVNGQISSGYNNSIVVRSTGEVVAFYNGVQTKTSGTFRARVYYSRRTAVNTWSAAVQVDANAALDNSSPIAVLGTSDRIHFIWNNTNSTQQRHLTSGNVLGTASALSGAGNPTLDVVSVIDGANIRLATMSAAGGSFFTSADNPTSSASSGTGTGTPTRLVDDSAIIYAIYRSATDSDLYVKSSSDFGSSYGTGIDVFTATIALNDLYLSKNQQAYQRGNNVVFPYLVNDNGVWKYNEYIIRTLGPPAQTLTPAKFTDPDTFLLPPVVAAGAVTLTPSLFTDPDTFLLPPVVTAPGPDQPLTPTLFTDSDTLYTPTITALAPPQTIAPNAQFLNTQLFFTPTATVTTSNTLTPSLYTDPDSFPSPHALTSTYTLTPTTYTDLDNFFGGRIDFGLNTTLYTDADNFFVPTVQAGAMGVVPPLYTDPDSFYGADISISGGIQTLTPALFTDPDTVYGGALTSNYSLTPTLFSDPDNLYGPTVSVGAVTVAPTRFDNSQTFFAPVVSGGGDVVLSVARYDDPDTFFPSSITVGASTLTPARYDDSDGFFAPSVSAGAATVVLAFLNDPDSFPAATVGAGAITLTPLRFTDPDNVFAPSLSVGAVTVLPTLFSDPDGFFVHGVVPGSTVVLPPLYGDPDVFFGGSIVGGIQIGGGGAFVSPPFIANVGSMMIRS